MNLPEQSQSKRTSTLSAEAWVGLGITIGCFGLLFLLLGWAQHMRQVKDAALILFGIGAVMFVVGAIAAMMGAKRRRS